MRNTIHIAILDDHDIVLEGLSALFQRNKSYHVQITATEFQEVLDILPTTKVDVLITDVFMPTVKGWDVCKTMKAQYPEIKLLALTMSDEPHILQRMWVEIGVDAFLLKNTSAAEMCSAIDSVLQGQRYLSPSLKAQVEFLKTQDPSKPIHFTPREVELIHLMLQQQTNKQMASALFISERTVETHRKNIFRKTDTHSLISLMKKLKEIGFSD